MRVIAGTCRSVPLSTVPGRNTRPTTDRIKETLFNILAPHIAECRFLDLFAGSGAIGIEALSRGASHACFADHSKCAVDVIRANLEHTHLTGLAEVHHTKAHAIARYIAGQEPYNLIYMDPPYGADLEKDALAALCDAGCIASDALIVLETLTGYDDAWISSAGFVIERSKVYKTNQHLFVRRAAKQQEDNAI